MPDFEILRRGDRVRYARSYPYLKTCKHPDREGTFTIRSKKFPDCIRVLWDGVKQPTLIHHTFLEKVDA